MECIKTIIVGMILVPFGLLAEGQQDTHWKPPASMPRTCMTSLSVVGSSVEHLFGDISAEEVSFSEAFRRVNSILSSQAMNKKGISTQKIPERTLAIGFLALAQKGKRELEKQGFLVRSRINEQGHPFLEILPDGQSLIGRTMAKASEKFGITFIWDPWANFVMRRYGGYLPKTNQIAISTESIAHLDEINSTLLHEIGHAYIHSLIKKKASFALAWPSESG